MPTVINPRDLNFLLYDWLDSEALCARPRFAAHSRDTFDPMLQTALRIAEEKFAPHAARLDAEEPLLEDGEVRLLPEVKVALDAFVEAGFLAAPFDEEVGGLQLPYVVTQAAMAMFYAANASSAAYPMLTMAGANLLRAHGSDEQRERFFQPMLEGRFYGTMCLSEPNAGSSLGDLRCLATPHEDGSYRLVGDKMWISGADHDLAENIVHLVLARTPDAPAGTKGISLFIVPKLLLDDDGAPAERNDVVVAGLNHKMGYRGTVNAVLKLGEEAGAVGYLVGELHQGLPYMFHMMNEARIGVGLGASMLGYAGFLYSLAYAKDRPQGRPAHQRDPTAPQVPIIEHADVRRMLLAQKAYVEGGLALGLYCARLVDEIASGDDDHQADNRLLLEVLTPIAKAWPSEFGLEANKLAIQVLGGYGYSREYPVERYYRDNRLNAIHEGTNGIQALDLLGRKVPLADGQALRLLLARVGETASRAADLDSLAEHAAALRAAVDLVEQTTLALVGAAMSGDVPRYLANASVYLDMLGHVVVAWLWLEQGLVATRLIEAASDDDERAFLRGKLQACRFFFRWELPKTRAQAELLQSLDDTTLATEADWL
jgi:butyryl-CoA dehydrogenase